MFANNSIRTASRAARYFSTTRPTNQRLRIGYVPEHFSTPLAFAHQHFSLDAELIPFPTGTGALTSSLKSDKSTDENYIDVAVGLTEGFVADLGRTGGKDAAGYGLVGTYVESPLCWAISTGARREDVRSEEDLKGKKVGVSRLGSGSYVMSYVLADQKGWLSAEQEPSGIEVIGDFAALRRSVSETKQQADFFMWEHFTTKHYWDNGELKRIGEIYTPWPSWMIAARDSADQQLEEMAQAINKGVMYYREHPEEAVEYITSTMHYSKEDAREWMKGVKFADDVRGVDPGVVDHAVGLLKKAGVLKESAGDSENMVAIKRAARARPS